ncbi:PKD domain-containing protein [Nocardioides zhouii]|nr:PKD domain-containing protein [Nocardioides zhouii]
MPVASAARRGGLSVVVALSFVLLAAPQVSAGVTLTPYPSLPMPWRMAVGGPQNHLFTAFLSNGTTQVTESTSSGDYLRPVSIGTVPLIKAFEVDAAGNLYLAFRDTSSNDTLLRKVSPSGSTEWETALAAGTSARDVSAGSAAIWLATDQGTTILKFSPLTGEFLGSIPASGAYVEALANGNVLASSSTTGITEYDPAGVARRTIPGSTGALDTTASGEVIAAVSTQSGASIRKFAADGSSTLGVDRGTSASIADLSVTPSGETWALSSNVRVHLDPTTPDAKLTASEAQAFTGAPVALDATGSFVPFASPSRFEWDLDGDGSFETDSGATGRISHAYDTPGIRTVTVRVTAPAGATATASTAVDVSSASPVGPIGVSINNGARYTNDPQVTVFMRWPTYAKDVVISNDGGFFPASQRPVGATMAWTLDSSGPERLPKTIYARFLGGRSGPETYQDDIILDETAPAVLEAGAKAPVASPRLTDLAPRLAKRRYVVTVRAVDKTSGVATMQVTSKKARPGAWRTYKKRSSFKSSSSKIFVRVRDGAGNVSRWKRLKIA